MTNVSVGGGGAPLAASDISSPDLGVDVSSDPFSSLERTSTLSEIMGGGNNMNARQTPGDYRILYCRHERKTISLIVNYVTN